MVPLIYTIIIIIIIKAPFSKFEIRLRTYYHQPDGNNYYENVRPTEEITPKKRRKLQFSQSTDVSRKLVQLAVTSSLLFPVSRKTNYSKMIKMHSIELVTQYNGMNKYLIFRYLRFTNIILSNGKR